MPNRKRLRAFATAAIAAAALVSAGSFSASAQSEPSPSDTRSSPAPLHKSSKAIKGRYIVTLSAAADPDEVVKRLGLKSQYSYKSAMRGFAGALSAAQLRTVRATPGVASVEEDAQITAAPVKSAARAVPATSWGLDRIDQPELPLDDQFNVIGRGTGTTGYILDTGIEYGHAQFGGRARAGFDAVGDGRGGQDCNGHGTHVAGTVAGETFGVAPAADLVSVRVLNCEGSGTWSGVIAGLDWVAQNAETPAVLNASLGGPRSNAVNSAVAALFNSGVLPVVAAGNESSDACDVSPASAPNAFTVGASDEQDDEASFSNYGTCLDIYAPGTNIVSARLGGGSVAHNGTSMASPHVAGVALLALETAPMATPDEVAGFLDTEATPNTLTVSAGSPNRLLFTGSL
ncbi:S8 family peptidase [Streptomyces sp. NPDC051907]|uniref:S8 family peptidase n=1 Tax=Streptomyces sp. NPDC051907 TaxID=3155284 RepID=UPI0034439957